MQRKQKLIGNILVDKGLINAEQLDGALAEQKKTKEFLGTILIKKGIIKERDLLAVLSEQFDIPLGNLKNKYIDWEFIKLFSASLIFDYRCVPISKDDWAVTFAITNPLDSRILQRAEEEARGLKVKWVLVCQEDVDEVITRYRQYLRGDIDRFFK